MPTVPAEAEFRYHRRIAANGGIPMLLIWLGALFIIAGVVVATLRTLRRGRLSQPRSLDADPAPDTLEPSGRGDRLSLGADLPGIGLALFGAVLLFVGAFL
jgi:hypothetical protein